MSRKYSYDASLHIASISSRTDWHRISVHTLMQDGGSKKPSLNAYLGARYSRSADSVVEIAREIAESGKDAASKLEAIFHGYGHKSVGDMADLFICIENVPMITAMRFFNSNPVLAGQERSTRFQNFKEPNFVKIPESIKISKSLRERYEAIILKQVSDYLELLKPTRKALAAFFKVGRECSKAEKSALKARTFDTVRYFLPLGLESSLGLVMSARSWADQIGQLRGSEQSIESELGDLLYELLSGTEEMNNMGYVPEADGLIRYTDPNLSRLDSAKAILWSVDTNVTQKLSVDDRLLVRPHLSENLTIKPVGDPVEILLNEYILLLNSLNPAFYKANSHIAEEMGKIMFTYHNHHKQIGNVAQSGAYLIDGFADFGVLKDLNRHRSFERFVPFWEDQINLEAEFNREIPEMYFLCNYLYLPGMDTLRTEFENRFNANYKLIVEWYRDAKAGMEPELVREFTRYLIPHAHAARYRFFASVDDLQYTINLRTRNGGHIAYRELTYSWLQKLAEQSSFWKPLMQKLQPVDVASREQFLDRS